MRILGIGESVIDKTYITRGLVVPKNIEPTINVGGPVLVSMILLARLGHEGTFITSLGHDIEANNVKRELYKENIYLCGEFNDKTKVHSTLINPLTGVRTKIRVNKKYALPDIESGIIRHFDVIILDRHHRDLVSFLEKHKKPSAKIILEPPTKQEIDRFLARISNFESV